MADRKQSPKEETTPKVVEETKVETRVEAPVKDEPIKEERPVTEVAKEEVAATPDRPQPITPRPSPRPTETTRPVEVPVTPRPTIDVEAARKVDEAFQAIIDNLPKRAEFDYRTNRMLADVLNNVNITRQKAKNFFKSIW